MAMPSGNDSLVVSSSRESSYNCLALMMNSWRHAKTKASSEPGGRPTESATSANTCSIEASGDISSGGACSAIAAGVRACERASERALTNETAKYTRAPESAKDRAHVMEGESESEQTIEERAVCLCALLCSERQRRL